MGVVDFLRIIIVLLVVIIGILGLLYLRVKMKEDEKEEDVMINSNNQKSKMGDDYGKFQGVLSKESIFEFMDFDEITDNMIVRKNATQFVMVLQCNGINYDLMSEQEKIAVEEGFVQFLNTLRFPIQLYVQTRTLNLRDIIEEYKARVESIATDIQKLEQKIMQERAKNNVAILEKLEFEKRRKENVLEYGVNITDYVEKMSSNKNVLQQKTYVIVSYYTAEYGGGMENYSKEEIINIAFSELYTRVQNVMSALATSAVTSKILESEELAELLYIAYNRDDAEKIQLSKALDANYDALYSTGKDILENKRKMLDEEINLKAIEMATNSIVTADKIRQEKEEKTKEEKIKEKASSLLDDYKDRMDSELYELAKSEVENSSEALESPKKRKTVTRKKTN